MAKENEEMTGMVEETAVAEKSGKKTKRKKKEEKPESVLKTILEYTLTILITVTVCYLFVRFVAVRSVVDGSSMYPTLSNNDNLVLEKVTYYFHDPERFDIIVFELEDDPGTHYIKRVIGLPGETVQIIDGEVYINGLKLEGDVYGKDRMINAYTAAIPIVLKEDEFFVLGDNRNNSKDSRSVSVGPVNRSQILGRAFFRFWPLTEMKFLVK